MLDSINATITLANGVQMPRFGLGTYKSAQGGDVEAAVVAALSLGYRSIDTASLYANEPGVGAGMRASGVPRGEVFVASKMWNDEQGYGETLAACERSLTRLGLDYLDLYLVHWPMPKTPQTWRALERLLAEGVVHSIGVCNHLQHHLDALLPHVSIPPMVNQFELHPWLTQPSLVEFCQSLGIVVEGWAPTLRGQASTVPELVEIGVRYGKTATQVALRWALQKDVVVIPKSTHAARIAENAAVFDFRLSPEEMATIDDLDRGERLGPHPDSFAARG